MSKTGVKILLLLLLPAFGMAQQRYLDSLHTALHRSARDSVRFVLYMQIGYYYQELDRDSALYYYDQALMDARKHDKKYAAAAALGLKGYQFAIKGRYARSLQLLSDALNIVDENKSENNSWFFSPGGLKPKNNRWYTLSRLQALYSVLMHVTKNTEQEIFYLKESAKNGMLVEDPYRIAIAKQNLGNEYRIIGKLDSALIEYNDALKFLHHSNDKKYVSTTLTGIGETYLKMGNMPLARKYLFAGLQSSIDNDNMDNLDRSYYSLTNYYLAKREKDSSLIFAKKTLQQLQLLPTGDREYNLDDVYENLSVSYRLHDQLDSINKYQALALIAKDSIYQERIKNLADFQNLGFRQQLHLRDVEKEQLAYQSRIRICAMLASIGVFMLIAFLLYRNSRNRKKANELLQKQKEEIEIQKENVEAALIELRSTQSQLIQREKMASLGELTAGIAHEIQNPLNFVNNFSEVNSEMLEELKAESEKPEAERDQQLETGLIQDLIENERKINHHGKRADFIVKGMLEHSRTGTGEKQAANINALADEFLKLSYHGLRAKDKNFDAELVTNFDRSIPRINIVQQDIGRVMVNLYNNAFYAVNQRSKTAGPDYKPTVEVSTAQRNGSVILSVKDNGTGIPENIREKIMQPFFTTKSTGEGTGLGLSLSYDIVVKGHGGSIDVDTREGEFTEFTVTLPL